LIIATTAHQSTLLDTIVSRAFIVRFDLVSDNQIHQLLIENNKIKNTRSESFQAIAHKLAM
jgi:DNA polymerase III delta prime subunit